MAIVDKSLDALFEAPLEEDEIEGMVQEGLIHEDDPELDVTRPEGGIVPLGEFDFEIMDANASLSQKGFYNVRFQAVAMDGPGAGLTIFDGVSWSPKANFIRFEFLDAVGLPREGKIRPKRDLVGRRFRAETTHETFNGRLQARVLRYIKPSDVQAAEPVPANDIGGAEITAVPLASAVDSRTALGMPDESEPAPDFSVAPATLKQIETIKRLARATGQRIKTDELTRQQASMTITSLLDEMAQLRSTTEG